MICEKKLRDIIYENINITHCYVLEQLRRGNDSYFTTKGKPRRINGFYYLYGCDCTYKTLDGKEKKAKCGDVVYLPPFCEYESYFYNFLDKETDAILVNMRFSDEDGNEFFLPNDLKVFNTQDNETVKSYFLDALKLSRQPINKITQIKSIAFEILSYFGTEDKTRKLNRSKYKNISKGIMYLENDIKQELSIEEIAKMCNMTSSYFRRIFQEYSGMSPIQFRIRKKLDVAKELLKSDSMSVFEISEYLGFENMTYFSRLFKKYEKISPKDFRKRWLEQMKNEF